MSQSEHESSQQSFHLKLPTGTPRWVVIVCVLVSSVVIPSFLAFSPHISKLIEEAIEARKAQANNEKTALGTILELVSTNSKQIQVLSEDLGQQKQEKKELFIRVTELEKTNQLKNDALDDCLGKLGACRKP